MSKSLSIIVAASVLVLLLVFSTTFTVKYYEAAIRSRFGQISEASVVNEPGLYFRLPFFIDQVIKFDRRMQFVETPLNELSTADGYQVLVKAFMLWQVKTEGDGLVQFYRQYESMDGAQRTVTGQFNAALATLSQFRFDELVGQQNRLEAAEAALKQVMASQAGKGLTPVTVGISQIVLPGNTATAVMGRMQASKKTEAELERSRGTAEAAGYRSRAATDANKVSAFADLRAQEIRSEANAEAAKYMEEMAKDEELAMFLSWLDTLRVTLSRGVTLVVPTDFEPMHLMDPETYRTSRGIPKPKRSLVPATQPEREGN